jgi:hypothetical protein
MRRDEMKRKHTVQGAFILVLILSVGCQVLDTLRPTSSPVPISQSDLTLAALLNPASQSPVPSPTPQILTGPTPLYEQAAVFQASLSLHPDRFSQFAWFYKPPQNEKSFEILPKYFDIFILTHHDEAALSKLQSLGVTSPILQYLALQEVQDPGNCTNVPYGNQAPYQEGDFCWINQNHPDWFLLDKTGNRISNGHIYYLDPGDPGYQAFWLQRARQTQDKSSWDGIFIDDVFASLSTFENLGKLPAKYPDDASYQTAVQGFLAYLYKSYFMPNQVPVIGNITDLRENQTWYQYLNYLDGAMTYSFAVLWSEGYLTPEAWETQMQKIDQTQALGKSIILVAFGPKSDLDRQTFALASYLLINKGGASFAYKYSDTDYYEQIWHFDDNLLALGTPLGDRYRNGQTWRRDFTNGYVLVNPVAHTSSINLTQATSGQ